MPNPSGNPVRSWEHEHQMEISVASLFLGDRAWLDWRDESGSDWNRWHKPACCDLPQFPYTKPIAPCTNIDDSLVRPKAQYVYLWLELQLSNTPTHTLVRNIQAMSLSHSKRQPDVLKVHWGPFGEFRFQLHFTSFHHRLCWCPQSTIRSYISITRGSWTRYHWTDTIYMFLSSR